MVPVAAGAGALLKGALTLGSTALAAVKSLPVIGTLASLATGKLGLAVGIGSMLLSGSDKKSEISYVSPMESLKDRFTAQSENNNATFREMSNGAFIGGAVSTIFGGGIGSTVLAGAAGFVRGLVTGGIGAALTTAASASATAAMAGMTGSSRAAGLTAMIGSFVGDSVIDKKVDREVNQKMSNAFNDYGAQNAISQVGTHGYHLNDRLNQQALAGQNPYNNNTLKMR